MCTSNRIIIFINSYRLKKVAIDKKKPLNKMGDLGSEKHEKIEVRRWCSMWLISSAESGCPNLELASSIMEFLSFSMRPSWVWFLTIYSVSSFYSIIEVASNSKPCDLFLPMRSPSKLLSHTFSLCFWSLFSYLFLFSFSNHCVMVVVPSARTPSIHTNEDNFFLYLVCLISVKRK